jgi:hypothetical protein
VTLARDGAYMYGDRRVSRAERSKWRLTFRSLAAQAQSALHAADTRPAEQAVEQLIDLACEIRNVDYFHSAPQLIRWESGYGWQGGRERDPAHRGP